MKKRFELMRQHFERGIALLERGDPGGAWDELTQAIRHAPRARRGAVYLFRARAAGERRDWQAVIDDATAAVRFDPSLGMAFGLRAAAYVNLGHMRQAIVDLRINQNPAAAYHLRSICRQSLGDLESAIDDLDTSIQLRPNDSLAYHGRAACYWALGDERSARADLERAAELGGDEEYLSDLAAIQKRPAAIFPAEGRSPSEAPI